MANPESWRFPFAAGKIVGGPHSNIALLVNRSNCPAVMFDPSHANRSAGADIRVYLADGVTEIAREVVAFTLDTTTGAGDGKLVLWCKHTSAATGGSLVIQFGDRTLADYAVGAAFGRNAVWADYQFVSHDCLTDSTGNHLITVVNAPASAAGPFGNSGGAAQFDGVNDHVKASMSIDASLSWSLSAWVNKLAGATAGRIVHVMGNVANKGFAFTADGTREDYNAVSGTTSTWTSGRSITASDNAGYAHLSAVFTGGVSALELYNNAAMPDVLPSGWGAGASTPQLTIGARNNPGSYFSGQVGEVWLRQDALSAGWRTTQYNNQSGPATFFDAPIDLGTGNSSLTLPKLIATANLFAPTLTAQGNSILTMPVRASSTALYAPVLVAQNNTVLTLSALSTLTTLYAPTLAIQGSPSLVLPALTIPVTLFSPTLTAQANSTLTLPALTVPTQLYAPTIAPQALDTLLLPKLSAGTTLYPPVLSLSSNATLELPKLSIPLQLFPPVLGVLAQGSLSLPRLQSRLRLHAPSIMDPALDTGFDSIDFNPFPSDVPSVFQDLDPSGNFYTYFSNLAGVLRSSYEGIQLGQVGISADLLRRFDDTAIYELGSVANFKHRTYGSITATYVGFVDMTGSAGGSPCGSLPDGDPNYVTNDYSKSSGTLVRGILAAAALPVSGQFGWLIVSGANLLQLTLDSTEEIQTGAELVWSGLGKLNPNTIGGVVATYVGAQPRMDGQKFMPGELYIQLQSSSGQRFNEALGQRIVTLEDTSGTTLARVQTIEQAISDEAGGLAAQITTIEAEFQDITASLSTERIARVNADGALSTKIENLSATFGANLSGAISAERTIRLSAEASIVSSIDQVRAVFASGLVAANTAIAAASNELVAIATTNEATVLKFQELSVQLEADELAITGNADAITALGATVTTQGTSITANAAAITQLDTELTTAEGDILGNASAITSLGSQVTSIDGNVTTLTEQTTRLEASQGYVFRETFDYAVGEFGNRWVNYSGAGEVAFVSGGVSSGNILRVGNNVGDDQAWLIHTDNIPYDSSQIYRMQVRGRRISGTGVTYVGWAGVAADGVTFVGVTGAASFASQHYHTLAAHPLTPNVNGWHEAVGYTRGFGSPNGSSAVAPLIASPGPMHSSVKFLRPLILVNYNGATGITEIDELLVSIAASDSASLAGATGASINSTLSTHTSDIAANASSLGTLTTTVNGNTSTLTTHSASINGLGAQWGVIADVNGRVTGSIRLDSGASKSVFSVLATKFTIFNNTASDVAPFEVVGGVVRVTSASMGLLTVDKIQSGTLGAIQINVGAGKIVYDNGTVVKVEGTGFGSANQFIEWFGVRPNPTWTFADLTEANAQYYLKTDGSAYFGGSLSAGVLYNSLTSSVIGISAEVLLGPFGTNGNSKSVVLSYAYLWSRTFTSNWTVTPPANHTVKLERRFGGGGWTTMATMVVPGSGFQSGTADTENPAFVDSNLVGSVTITDTEASLLDFEYRATMTVWASIGSTGSFTGPVISQRLTVASTEE